MSMSANVIQVQLTEVEGAEDLKSGDDVITNGTWLGLVVMVDTDRGHARRKES
jgi:preprotein translocase subunit YajC